LSIYIRRDAHTHPSAILRHTVSFMLIATPHKVSFQTYEDIQFEVNERKCFLKTVVKFFPVWTKIRCHK